MSEQDSTRLMTYEEVVREFGIKIGTLYALVSKREIPHVRFGKRFVRFSRAQVEGWIASHSVECKVLP